MKYCVQQWAHSRAAVAWLSGCPGAVRCTVLDAFLLQGPAVYLISAHPEPTCAHSISGPQASTPVQSPVCPGRNRAHVEVCHLRRKGRRRVHDVSFLWSPVDRHQGPDMTGSGEPIPPRPFLIQRRDRTAVQQQQGLHPLSIPLPLFLISIFAHQGRARPAWGLTAGQTRRGSCVCACVCVLSTRPRRDVRSSLRGASRMPC